MYEFISVTCGWFIINYIVTRVSSLHIPLYTIIILLGNRRRSMEFVYLIVDKVPICHWSERRALCLLK